MKDKEQLELELELKEKLQELKEYSRELLFDLVRISIYTVLLQWLWNDECHIIFNLPTITLLQSLSLLMISAIFKNI